MIAILIFAVILTLTCACIMLLDEFAESEYIRVVAFICAISILTLSIVEIDKPSAKDVYKGETMLQVTYDNDGTPVDTIVVFKNPRKNIR